MLARCALVQTGSRICDAEEHEPENAQLAAGDETIFRRRRSDPETKIGSTGIDQTTGFGHVGRHHQPVLSQVLQSFAVRHPKVPVTTGRLASPQTLACVRGRPSALAGDFDAGATDTVSAKAIDPRDPQQVCDR
jgi:hypothetical protein